MSEVRIIGVCVCKRERERERQCFVNTSTETWQNEDIFSFVLSVRGCPERHMIISGLTITKECLSICWMKRKEWECVILTWCPELSTLEQSAVLVLFFVPQQNPKQEQVKHEWNKYYPYQHEIEIVAWPKRGQSVKSTVYSREERKVLSDFNERHQFDITNLYNEILFEQRIEKNIFIQYCCEIKNERVGAYCATQFNHTNIGFCLWTIGWYFCNSLDPVLNFITNVWNDLNCTSQVISTTFLWIWHQKENN